MVKKNIKKNIKKINKKVDHGQVHIQASFNNTIVTITDTKGNVLAWSSAGKLGFKGSKKSTSYAAQMASEAATKDSLVYGLNKVDVFVKGPGQGREVAIRAVETNGLKVLSIKDVTPIPHNGCRPPKKRRI